MGKYLQLNYHFGQYGIIGNYSNKAFGLFRLLANIAYFGFLFSHAGGLSIPTVPNIF